MKVVIISPLDTREIEVTPFDTTKTILMRFASVVPGTTDSFFIPKTSEYVVEEGTVIEVDDVRQEVTDREVSKMRELALRYGISHRWTQSMWFARFEGKALELETKKFRLQGVTTFSSAKGATDEITNFKSDVENHRKRMKAELASYVAAYEVLSTYPTTPPADPIEIDGTQSFYQALIPTRKELVEIFDAIVPSEGIPFAVYRGGTNTIFKVYSEATIPEVWQNEVYEEDGVYFKIRLKKSTRATFIERTHASVRWYANHQVLVEYSLPSSGGVKESIEESLYETFKEHFSGDMTIRDLSYSEEKQLAIKCTFGAKVQFNTYCLAYAIHTDPKLYNYIFLNETVKPEPLKPRFHIFFNPHSTDLQSSSVFQVTADSSFPGKVKVRLGRCKDRPSAVALRETFRRLMGRYEETLPESLEYFKIFKSKLTTLVKAVAKKPNRKAGARLLALQAADPQMFGDRYADQVQKGYQPYIVPPEEVEEIRAALGDNKIMEFEGVVYACQEPGVRKANMFPGLKVNKNTKSKNPGNTANYPLLPYCLSSDQYANPNSVLSTYLREGVEAAIRVKDKSATTKQTYIVASTKKLVGPGRDGTLYVHIDRLVGALKLPQEYFRRGVAKSPDSIFHACASVMDPAYDQATEQKRNAMVAKIKEDMLATTEVIYASKQETFDYYREDYTSELKNPKRYLAPEVWTTALEVHLGIRIVLLMVDEDHPNGEFMERRSTRAFLPRAYPDSKKAVIMAVENRGGQYPYQCEILVRVDKHKRTALFDSDPLVDKLASFALNSSKVYVVSPDIVEGKDIIEYPRSIV